MCLSGKKFILPVIFLFLSWFLFFCFSCKEARPSDDPVMVAAPEDMDAEVSKALQSILQFATGNSGKVNDSTTLMSAGLVDAFYQNNGYKSIWSAAEVRGPMADSLLLFINQSRYYGLFPNDYHFSQLLQLHDRLQSDSSAVRDAAVWTRLDVVCTDAFFRLLKDLKEGRMVPDSLSILHQEKYRDSFFFLNLNEVTQQHLLSAVLQRVEPSNFKYQQIREALPAFVDSMDPVQYPQIIFPYTDSLKFVSDVWQRFTALNLTDSGVTSPDSLAFARAVKKYQVRNKLEADGKPGPATIKELNTTDDQKFKSIAITLDRYKALPAMPETYIWVNIPSFHLQVIRHDSIILESKIIVGKPSTPTPELTSSINNLVLYPTWTIPASIIKQEILPAIKKDPNYLSRKGYNLYDDKGEIINPYDVNWSRYNSGIPWRVVQGSGDDNALGIFKFNFNNPYSVYLHDTNQRYLFANANRALSHGCVRVQKWQQLADIIAERDSSMASPSRLSYSEDSIQSWITNGVRKSVTVRNRYPLYIVYYTCDVRDGELRFYTDIYNEDAGLYNRYFAKKEG